MQSLSVQSSLTALRIFQKMAEEQTTFLPVANAEEEQTTPLPETNAELKQDKKGKRKVPKKVPEAAKKKARRNLTSELPKGTVCFDNIVLMKLGKKAKNTFAQRVSKQRVSSKITTTETSDAPETFTKKLNALST